MHLYEALHELGSARNRIAELEAELATVKAERDAHFLEICRLNDVMLTQNTAPGTLMKALLDVRTACAERDAAIAQLAERDTSPWWKVAQERQTEIDTLRSQIECLENAVNSERKRAEAAEAREKACAEKLKKRDAEVNCLAEQAGEDRCESCEELRDCEDIIEGVNGITFCVDCYEKWAYQCEKCSFRTDAPQEFESTCLDCGGALVLRPPATEPKRGDVKAAEGGE